MLGLWLIFMDPPSTPGSANFLTKDFARSDEGLAPTSRDHRRCMLKPLQASSEIDLMREFANPMPVRIILEMLGIPQDLKDTFVEWSRAIAIFEAVQIARGTSPPPRISN